MMSTYDKGSQIYTLRIWEFKVLWVTTDIYCLQKPKPHKVIWDINKLHYKIYTINLFKEMRKDSPQKYNSKIKKFKCHKIRN